MNAGVAGWLKVTAIWNEDCFSLLYLLVRLLVSVLCQTTLLPNIIVVGLIFHNRVLFAARRLQRRCAFFSISILYLQPVRRHWASGALTGGAIGLSDVCVQHQISETQVIEHTRHVHLSFHPMSWMLCHHRVVPWPRFICCPLLWRHTVFPVSVPHIISCLTLPLVCVYVCYYGL